MTMIVIPVMPDIALVKRSKPSQKRKKVKMSGNKPVSLLWVNKDASNLHSKKHLAEVNAHVQKGSSRERVSKRRSKSKSGSPTPARDDRPRSRHSQSPTLASSQIPTRSSSMSLLRRTFSEDSTYSLNGPIDDATYDGLASDDALPTIENLGQYDASSLSIITQLAHAQDYLANAIPQDFDPNPLLPTFVQTGLSAHDNTLIDTYQTYMPQTLFGSHSRSLYTPIQTISSPRTTKDPLGLLWVLISLDMFLARIRGQNDNNELILQRKNVAYKLMSERLNDQYDTESVGFLIGTGSAALAELFFGDPAKADMHLCAIRTVFLSKGSADIIMRLPPAITLPLLGAFAHHVSLQEYPKPLTSFDAARTHFMDALRSLVGRHNRGGDTDALGYHNPSIARSDDDKIFVSINDGKSLRIFQDCKRRAFDRGTMLRKFTDPALHYNKASDWVDHFILLYNLTMALHEFGNDYSTACHFIEGVCAGLENAAAYQQADVLLSISIVRCNYVSFHAQTFSTGANEGVLRVWAAIHSLVVFKLLSPESKAKIYNTLFAILTMDGSIPVATLEDIDDIDLEASTSWWSIGGTEESSP